MPGSKLGQPRYLYTRKSHTQSDACWMETSEQKNGQWSTLCLLTRKNNHEHIRKVKNDPRMSDQK